MKAKWGGIAGGRRKEGMLASGCHLRAARAFENMWFCRAAGSPGTWAMANLL